MFARSCTEVVGDGRRTRISFIPGNHLENVVRIFPESARAHFALARGYRRAGRVEEAEKETVLFEKFKKGDTPGATSSPSNVPPNE